jgi:hypothetical protein
MWIELSAAFCCYEDSFRTIFNDSSNSLFAFTIAINIGRIYKIDTSIYGGIQYFRPNARLLATCQG